MGILHVEIERSRDRVTAVSDIVERRIGTVNGRTLAETEKVLDRCDLVIDCGFAVGPLNRGNLELLDHALGSGKTVLSLRPSDSREMSPPCDAGDWICCRDLAQLMELLDRRFCAPIHPQSPISMEKKAS
jgi:iron complex transport system ATP-binding protein